MDREMWTVEYLAERWDVAIRTVRDMLSKGELKGFKVRNSWRIPYSEIERYEQREMKPASNVRASAPRAVVTRIV